MVSKKMARNEQNTPTIIRFPFEKMVKQMPEARLVRVNLSRPDIPPGIAQKGIGIQDDIRYILNELNQLQ